VQELSFALATAIALLDSIRARPEVAAEEFPELVGRISFFVNAGMRFVTELCAVIAGRRLTEAVPHSRMIDVVCDVLHEASTWSDDVPPERHAMRYGNPTTESRIKALVEQGCDRILLVPLYPQSCAATSATACDKAFEALMKMRWQPAVRVAPPWHDDPVYVDALARTVRTRLGELDWTPDMIVTSFHGVPRSYLLKGDPYHCQCMKTGRLLREALELDKDRFMVCFQSRFGNEEWLKPYLIDTMGELPARGIKKVLVIAPGFSADCLETLEEIEGENAEHFMHHGGEKFAYVPCLNDSDEGMEVIQAVVERELQGWM
jgi:ferrochelatase